MFYTFCVSCVSNSGIVQIGVKLYTRFPPAVHSKNQILPAGICLHDYLLSKGSVPISFCCFLLLKYSSPPRRASNTTSRQYYTTTPFVSFMSLLNFSW